MKKLIVLISLWAVSSYIFAQNESSKIKCDFYGFLRGDFYYDSRQSVTGNECLFFLYPKDEEKDINGEDLNAVPNSGLYSFNSRVGIDVSGLRLLQGELSGKFEADFAGFGVTSAILRVRQAYMKLSWEKSSLWLGQAWHPMFLPVYPNVLSLATGAPFNPFNRSSQLRFNYRVDNVTLCGAALYQLQFTSNGPIGKSTEYQKNAIIPELFAGIDYKYKDINIGAGIDYLTLKPRTRSTVDDRVYKVDESISSLSLMAYAKYTQNLFSVSAKTVYGQNLSDQMMLGGYGISKINSTTGAQEYTNFTHSTVWLNLSYGKKYMGNFFAGYTKNLGTGDPLVKGTKTFGEGLTMNDLVRVCGTFSYNVPKFSAGIECEISNANYGDANSFDWYEGIYKTTHGISDIRLLGVITYYF